MTTHSTPKATVWTERISKAAWIWGGWLLVVALLMGLAALYGVSLHRQLQGAAWQQSEAVAKLIAIRITGRLQHMDDILLHTQDAFDRFGPGLTRQDTVLSARRDRAERHHVLILNAAGDPILSVPPQSHTRNYSDLVAKAMAVDKGSIFSFAWTEGDGQDEGGAMARAMPLQFSDGTFAGAVLVLTPTDWLRETLQDPAQSYGLSMRLLLRGQPVAQDSTHVTWSSNLEGAHVFDMTPEEMQLQVKLQDAEIDRAWWAGFRAIATVLSLCCLALLMGALWLHRAVSQQMRSAVAAELSGRQALVKARFLANMSHELRTPMTGVLGAVELLYETQPTAAQRKLLDLIRSSGQHLMNILNDVLDVSRMDFKAMQLDLQPCAVLQVLQDATQILMPKAQLQGIALYAQLDLDAHWQAHLDAFRLTQVLTNLLGNAIKFTAQGHVLLQAHLERGPETCVLKIAVIDTGIGIDAEHAKTLFEPFSQADLSTSRRYGGSGLGLFISKRLVQLMGGQLGVDSQLGQGSRFWLEIPLQEAPPLAPATDTWTGLPEQVLLGVADPLLREALQIHLRHLGVQALPADFQRALPASVRCVIADAQSGASPAALALSGHAPLWVHAGQPHGDVLPDLMEPMRRADLARQLCLRHRAVPEVLVPPASTTSPSPASLRGVRVLIAEDNMLTQQILEMFMASLGCEVMFVHNGQEAIDAVRDHAFDIVLMDCHMPGVDGYEATRTIRQRQALVDPTVHLPILALTAATMPEDVALAMAAGMDEVCSKPIDRAHLKARLLHWRQVALAQAVDAEV